MIRRHSTIAALAFAAALLSSCGSDPQTGTSSETQTELQLLADNSRWITKPQSGTSSGAAPAARRATTASKMAAADCPPDSSTYYHGIGGFERVWRGSCAASPDSLSQIRHKRSLKHGPSGSVFQDFLETESREAWIAEGHGRMRLRGNLELKLDTFRVAMDGAGMSAFYQFRFSENCTFEYRATATPTESGYIMPEVVRSVVTCRGKAVGFVVWNSSMGMQVQDLEGRNIRPLARPEATFREDSLGLQLIELTPRSETDKTPIGGKLRLRLLDDEILPDTATFWARDTGGFGSYLTSWSGRAYRDGSFEADFSYAPYKPWQIEVRGGSWEAISSPILP